MLGWLRRRRAVRREWDRYDRMMDEYGCLRGELDVNAVTTHEIPMVDLKHVGTLLPRVVVGDGGPPEEIVAGPGGVLVLPHELVRGEPAHDEFMEKLIEHFRRPVPSTLPPPRFQVRKRGDNFVLTTPTGHDFAWGSFGFCWAWFDRLNDRPFGRVTTF